MQEIKSEEEAEMLPWKERSLTGNYFFLIDQNGKECDEKKIQLNIVSCFKHLPSIARAFSFSSVL